jgi:hypothetical protein
MPAFQDELFRFLDNSHPSLAKKIAEKKQLDDSLKGELKQIIEEFKEKFVAADELTWDVRPVMGIPNTVGRQEACPKLGQVFTE